MKFMQPKCLFLFYLFVYLVNLYSIHPFHFPAPTPWRSGYLNKYNVFNNIIIELHSPNFLHICIVGLGMITMLWLLWLHICNHVRFLSFATNLSLLVKKKYITFQFYPIFIKLFTLGLLIDFEEYYLLLFFYPCKL